MLDKTIRAKIFNAIDGSDVTVEIFVKRITIYTGSFKAQYSCYDVCLIDNLHSEIISPDVLIQIHSWINNNCTYLKPKEEQKNEGEQFSLF